MLRLKFGCLNLRKPFKHSKSSLPFLFLFPARPNPLHFPLPHASPTAFTGPAQILSFQQLSLSLTDETTPPVIPLLPYLSPNQARVRAQAHRTAPPLLARTPRPTVMAYLRRCRTSSTPLCFASQTLGRPSFNAPLSPSSHHCHLGFCSVVAPSSS